MLYYVNGQEIELVQFLIPNLLSKKSLSQYYVSLTTHKLFEHTNISLRLQFPC